MYHTEPPTDKTIREWYMNSSRVAACALRNEQAVRAYGQKLALTSLTGGGRSVGIVRSRTKATERELVTNYGICSQAQISNLSRIRRIQGDACRSYL